MKNLLKLLLVSVLLILPIFSVNAEDLGDKLKGRILLQVEAHGEAFYVNPVNAERYYMANGDEAYSIMRNLSIGITNANLSKLQNSTNEAIKHKGKIFLQVEAHGEAYYVDFSGNLHYLKNGAEAYNVMRDLGLGITNNDLLKIKTSQKSAQVINDKPLTSDGAKSEDKILENKTTDYTNSNEQINKDILSINDIIFSRSQLKNGNLNFIQSKENEMKKYPNYYTYQNLSEKLINEVKKENYLIDSYIFTANNISDELKRLLNTGKTTSENLEKLLTKLTEGGEKIKLSSDESKKLIETSVVALSEAEKKELAEMSYAITKMEECNESIKGMNQEILTIKSDYYAQVELIKKQTISSNTIYGRIDKLTDDANLKIDIINNQISQKQLDCSSYFNN